MKHTECLENEVLKGKFGPKTVKKEEIWRNLHSEDLQEL